MNKQIVVRTYDETMKNKVFRLNDRDEALIFPNDYFTSNGELEEKLEEGYKIVMCHQIGMALEYILEKPEVRDE